MGGTVLKEASGGTITEGIYESMLEDYNPSCRYLKGARYNVEDERLGAHGTFAIPSSCYCESTGHFNAVEFIICFNQLGFVFFSEAIERGDLPELQMKKWQDLRTLQLGGAYITRVKDMVFKRPINPVHFNGSVYITRSKVVKNNAFYHMESSFSDSQGGNARALINVVALQ